MVRRRVKKNIVWTTVVVGVMASAAAASAQWRGPYPPYGPAMRYDSAVRLDVKPKQTEVYIDGYYVGIVDDFDGLWQRLRIDSGEHEIALFLEGHRAFREKFLFRPGQTLKLQHTMEPAPAGEIVERPKPTEGARVTEGPPPGRAPLPRGARGASTFGTLALRVQPSDAEILIDGERWTLGSGEGQLLVEVADGVHRLEIRKEGYRPFSTTVMVRRGETVPLNVSLARQ